MMGNSASRVGAGLLLLGWLAPAAASAANLGAVVCVREDRARHRRAHGRGGIRGRGLVAAGHPRARHAAGLDAERRLCARLRHAARRRAVQRRGLRYCRLAEDVGRHGRGGAAAGPSHHVQGRGRQRHQRGPAGQGARHDAPGQQGNRVQAPAGRRALHRHGRAARESRPARGRDHAPEHGQLPVRRSQGADVREHSLLHGAASREGLRTLLQQFLPIRVQLRRVESPLRVVQLRWRRAGPVLHPRRLGREDPRALHVADRAGCRCHRAGASATSSRDAATTRKAR